MCACNNKEMFQVQQAVKKADPDSFLIVLESNEVHGEGFKMVSDWGGKKLIVFLCGSFGREP